MGQDGGAGWEGPRLLAGFSNSPTAPQEELRGHCIELLSPQLLTDHAGRADYFWRLSRRLAVTPGWHYILDWVWLDRYLGDVRGKCVLDAGAGIGLMQWHLASSGATVISVDRCSRSWLPLHLRFWYNAQGFRSGDLPPFLQVLNPLAGGIALRQRMSGVVRSVAGVAMHAVCPRAPGRVMIYTRNLCELPEVSSESVDLVVAVSSLEHNPPDEIEAVLSELSRVLKPGGVVLATMSAAYDEDWYHAPSDSWCYSEATLRRMFRVPSTASCNYADYPSIMKALRACDELRTRLPRSYYLSGRNGMPWGVWNPVYLPVGIVATKVSRRPIPREANRCA